MADDLTVGKRASSRPRRKPAPGLEAKVAPVELALEALPPDERAASAHLLIDEQVGLIRAQRRNEDLGSGLKLLTGIAGLAAALAVAIMVWQASNARGLVIEAFSVPPDMAEQGLTGQVLAGQLEDRLSQMQARTDSARAPESYANDWGNEIRVEIPQTGVSISELQRWLRQSLGHQTRVGGEVFRTPAGDLRLTVRSGGEAGDTAIGKPEDLDRLMQEGAEKLFARTQPYRYGIYLTQNGRLAEAVPLFQRLSREGPVKERAWAVMGLGLLAPLNDKIAFMSKAVALDPNNALALINLSQSLEQLGHSQAAVEAARRAIEALKRSDRGGLSEASAAVNLPTMTLALAARDGDYGVAIRQAALIGQVPNVYGSQVYAPVQEAAARARNHDIAGAESLLPPGKSDAQITRDLQPYGLISVSRYEIARARGDWAGALAELDGLLAEGARILAEFGSTDPDPLGPLPSAARAGLLARLGRFDEANATAATLPRDCYDCLITRAVVEDVQGRRVLADRWFAAAVAAGPDLVDAQIQWGQARLRRRDAAGALAQAEAALRNGPRAADAWAIQGEAQLMLGKPKEAVRSLRKATTFAPRWKRARLLLATALERSGNSKDGREQRRIAAGLV